MLAHSYSSRQSPMCFIVRSAKQYSPQMMTEGHGGELLVSESDWKSGPSGRSRNSKTTRTEADGPGCGNYQVTTNGWVQITTYSSVVMSLQVKSNQNQIKSNYFIVRLKVDQRAGQLSLPHLGITKTEKIELKHKTDEQISPVNSLEPWDQSDRQKQTKVEDKIFWKGRF